MGSSKCNHKLKLTLIEINYMCYFMFKCYKLDQLNAKFIQNLKKTLIDTVSMIILL